MVGALGRRRTEGARSYARCSDRRHRKNDYVEVGKAFILIAMSRAALFRELAEKCKRKAGEADREESRRAWLIVARDWLAMAAREEAKEAPPNTE